MNIWIYIYIYIRSSFDAGVGGCFAGTLQIRMPRGRFICQKDSKCIKKGTFEKGQHGAKREPKTSQSQPRNLRKHNGVEKVRKNGEFRL